MKGEIALTWNEPILTGTVQKEWVDYNGHLNDAEYARIFSLAVDELMICLGIDETFRTEQQYTIYTLETHILYVLEMHQDSPYKVEAHLIDHDAKRLHMFFTLFDADGNKTATSEQMLMGIDQSTGRAGNFPEVIHEQVLEFKAQSDTKETPKEVGRVIGIRKK